MSARRKRSTASPALKPFLKDCISEHSGDPVYSNFWIKVGLPRNAVAKLKALGQKLGFQKTPTAAAVRLVALVSLLHPDEIESWIAEVEAKHPSVLSLGSEHKGCDPVQN